MAWKISMSLQGDPEAFCVVQQMIYAAVKTHGATDVEACAAVRSLRDAMRQADGEPVEVEFVEPQAQPVQIDLEYDEETLTLLIRDDRLPPSVPAAEVQH